MSQNFNALGLVRLVLQYGPISLCCSSNCTFYCHCLHDTTLHQYVSLTRDLWWQGGLASFCWAMTF